MTTDTVVKIPRIEGKISTKKRGEKEYVQYLVERRYNAEKKYSEPERILIGRKIEGMPGLMYPNNNYELFLEAEGRQTEEEMTPEEQDYVRQNDTYNLYIPFFEGLYHELKQLTHARGSEGRVNRYKAESINKVLAPLKEMMKDEAYAEFLGFIDIGDNRREGMSYSDAMILMTQYKSALARYRKGHV